MTKEQRESLIELLKNRFENNVYRHKKIKWADVCKRLDEDKLRSLDAMEGTGGEPDVVDYDAANDQYIFCDCSAESPRDRRSVCYDRQALDARKANKPRTSALDMAEEMGIELLTEQEYCNLQKLGKFDTKTSSWLKTPDPVRKLGGAIFGDFRYGRVFIYHNGADSYYAARGFRGLLRV